MWKVALGIVVGLCLNAASHAGSINEDFKDHLSGRLEIDDTVLTRLWDRFLNDFGEESPNKDKDTVTRQTNLRDKLQAIVEHNSNPDATFQKGINKFSDMTHAEFRDYFNLQSIGDDQKCSATKSLLSEKSRKMLSPPFWDWRDYGGVSPVKNQGKCGSCWTFSTVGCLEAHALIRYGATGNYSEQQLVDCAQAFENNGCNGGLPSHAFEYIESAGGISTETAYPYDAKDHKCTVKRDSFALSVSGGSINITKGDEEELKYAVFQHGPVSVAFDVVDGFGDYTTGVYASDTCKSGTEDVNHAVLAVGYGEENGVPFWIVKNSWGPDWGDEGYFKIKRGVNMCGIAVCNSFPKEVKKTEPVEPLSEKSSLLRSL